MVYVQDINGKPLMPITRHGKVRRLLKDKKAVVVNLCPFTIKLMYATSDYKQEIVLGVDAGTKHVGLSATTKSKELYSSEVILRNDIVDLLSTRRELRKTRRNRLRYRKPRFDNRVKSKRSGWIAPSVKYKIDAHIRIVDNVCSILPISRIVIEVAQFDTQKIKNPNISGKEYQEGDQLGFWNIREYVLARDGHKCQYCKGKSKDSILNVHHIESRNRLRYRKPRFDNRVKSKRSGWIAPSVKYKIDAHIRIVDNVCSILPISRIVIEVAQFDTQKIKNPNISGKEYQEGDQLGFWNIREYVLARDGHKCQYCKGKSKDSILNVHHIESRKTGGDSPYNLITLCETCHKEYHKGNIDLKIRRGKSLRDAAVMGIMKWRLYEELKSKYDRVSMTFGYITKHNRIKYGIEKSHTSDAFVISMNINAKRIERQYLKRLIRRHNRQMHKMKILKGGKKKNNQAPFEVFGFRLFDKVLYDNKICFVYGRRKSGNFNIRDFNGENPKDVSRKKFKLIRGKRHPIILK